MLLYLVRHGETYLNKYGKMQGWADAPLTEAGCKSAEDCGAKLSDIAFDAIFSSDLGRTVQTAARIAQCQEKAVEIQQLPAFRESFFGSYEGEDASTAWTQAANDSGYDSVEAFWQALSIEEIMDAFHDSDKTGDAEDYAAFWHRVEKGLEDLAARFDDGEKVLLVTHGNTIRNIAYQADRGINGAEELLNAGITLIDWGKKEKRVVFYNQAELPKEEGSPV